MHKFEIDEPHFLPHAGCELKLILEPGVGSLVIGENGVGKTTLAKFIREQCLETSTFIEQKPLDHFYDRSLGRVKKILLDSRKGMLHQDRFERLWNAFGLDQKEDRLLTALSGGENQALKLVMGLSSESELYILDEPSQFLDDKKKDVLSLICRNLLDQKKYLLVIEHDFSWIPPGWNQTRLILNSGWIRRQS